MKSITIYTDGACSFNPGPGGWAAILMFGIHKKEISGYEENTTNNRMELTAVIKALQTLKESCIISLYTDSQYVAGAFNEGWIFSWKKNNWKKSGGEIKNLDLWKVLSDECEKHKINFIRIKGHADNEYNNRCDQLARKEIEKNFST